jgi:hypothetical protein
MFTEKNGENNNEESVASLDRIWQQEFLEEFI